MANVRWYIDVVYKNGAKATYGPMTYEVCEAKWKEFGKQTATVKTIEKRREIDEEP